MILGFNTSDDPKVAKELLDSKSATFPSVMDSSPDAIMISHGEYKISGVPCNYLIDPAGKIVDAWYGNDYDRAERHFDKLKTQ